MKFKKLRRKLKADSPRIGRWLKRHRLRTKAKAPKPLPSLAPTLSHDTGK